MPLSEEEQRILHEMEKKLYEHDRAFADRVSTKPSRGQTPRSSKGWIVAFIAGFVLLVVAFGSSLLLGSLGFLIMLGAAVVYVYRVRQSDSARFGGLKGSARRSGMSDELSEMRRRLRSRFGNRN
jgi:Flp pilus assembly protein TadB